MLSSGSGSPDVSMSIAEREVRAKRFVSSGRSGNLTARRIWNGLEALSAIPYYLLMCPLTQPRRMTRFLETLFDYQRNEKVVSGNQRLIPTVQPEQLFSNLFQNSVSLLDLGLRPSGTTFVETYIMVCLIKYLRPKTIFEFGTFEGRTALQFCLNASEDSTIFTLDLPAGDSSVPSDCSCPEELSSRQLPIGGFLAHYRQSGRVTQLLQDSANMNFEPFRGTVDFIFIDGDHGMKYVKSDTENAFSMLSPQGVILWHDYGGRWPDVGRYLRETSTRKKLYHFSRTSLVFYGAAMQGVWKATHGM